MTNSQKTRGAISHNRANEYIPYMTIIAKKTYVDAYE